MSSNQRDLLQVTSQLFLDITINNSGMDFISTVPSLSSSAASIELVT